MRIQEEINDKSQEELEEELKNKVWPVVISIGFLAEFYNQLLLKERKRF